jgi:hypothetical protein
VEQFTLFDVTAIYEKAIPFMPIKKTIPRRAGKGDSFGIMVNLLP